MNIQGHTYSLGCVVFDANSLYTAFAAHEVGHALGFVHSFIEPSNPCNADTKSPDEYCDPWDIMSALNTWRFAGPYYPATAETQKSIGTTYNGPGINAPNLLHQGWLPSSNVVTYDIGSSAQTITLNALSHPAANKPMVVEIRGSDPNDVYTVEYRQQDGWDAGLPQNAIVMHEYKVNQVPWSYLIPHGNYDDWTAGATWEAPTTSPTAVPPVIMHVRSIDPSSGTATIVVEPYTPFPNLGDLSVKILSPANGAVFNTTQKITFTGELLNSGAPAPSPLTWSVTPNIGVIATGAQTTTKTITTPGTYTVTATYTPASGDPVSAHITIVVNPAPAPTATPPTPTSYPKPTVQITSPTAGQTIVQSGNQGVEILLNSTASAGIGVGSFAWSDSLGLFTDYGQDDIVMIPQPSGPQFTCGPNKDTITLTVTDSHGQTATASVQVSLVWEYCVN